MTTENQPNHLDNTSQLRKHYAGLAMQAILGNEVRMNNSTNDRSGITLAACVAQESLVFADALIAELAKKD